MRGKEGFSLGTCNARASQASPLHTLRLYNYILRFHLIMPRFQRRLGSTMELQN